MPEVTEWNSDGVEALKDLAAMLRSQGQWEDAITLLRRAIELKPELAELHNNLGNAYADGGRFEEAIAELKRAIAIWPGYAQAHNNLGAAMRDAGRPAEAIAFYENAIHLQANFAEAYNNLGAALADTGDLKKAIRAFRRAILVRPDYAEAHTNLGVALCDNGDDAEEAVAACRRAIALQPDLAIAHSNLALVLLTLGHYEEGWRQHEWRFRCGPRFTPREFGQPAWDGGDIDGKTILLHAEQGFGDAIQFARYVPLVARLGVKVVLECHRELARLMQGLEGASHVVAAGQTLPDFDVHCSLMSLPWALEHRVKDIPAKTPYLFPKSEIVDFWRIKTAAATDVKKVGLVWAGRPTHTNDRHRSMNLEQLAPLGNMEKVVFYSLQKGPAAQQATSALMGIRLNDFTSELADFADTAALIANLDLVIAVDTAVAHLAGAMGKAVWVMLPLAADWRWMREGAGSSWYPTMRLFRQKRWGDWEGVVQDVRAALQQVTAICNATHHSAG